jgi:hypothetical protein
MNTTQKVFRYQGWHMLLLIVLIIFIKLYTSYRSEILEGTLWGLSTRSWFWLAVIVPIIHQIYVWLVWRIELYKQFFTKSYGLTRAFRFYAIGFSLLFVSRLVFVTILAYSSRDTLHMDPIFSYALALTITPLVIYLFYSVKKYFTLNRAYGIDHFDKNYSEPFVKKGIFRYTSNGMYLFGLMILYLPGLLLMSEAALLVALFNHIYIWVHYYTTERPDMVAIYGSAP